MPCGFIAGSFVRDIAALNKMETLPWDGWGLMLGDEERFTMSADALLAILPAEDVTELDRLALLTSNAVDVDAIRAAYQSDERLRVPPEIQRSASS